MFCVSAKGEESEISGRVVDVAKLDVAVAEFSNRPSQIGAIRQREELAASAIGKAVDVAFQKAIGAGAEWAVELELRFMRLNSSVNVSERLDHIGENFKELRRGGLRVDLATILGDDFVPIDTLGGEGYVVLGEGAGENFEVIGGRVGGWMIADGRHGRETREADAVDGAGWIDEFVIVVGAGGDGENVSSVLDEARLFPRRYFQALRGYARNAGCRCSLEGSQFGAANFIDSPVALALPEAVDGLRGGHTREEKERELSDADHCEAASAEHVNRQASTQTITWRIKC